MRRAYCDTAFGQIHYRVGGSGDPLVLIHQTADSGRMFTEVFPALAKRFHVFAPDTPGFGGSDKPASPPGIDGYVRAIGAFLDGVGVQRAHLLGHHSGATFALAFAAAHPDRVDKLVLCAVPDFDPVLRKLWLEPVPIDKAGGHMAKTWERIEGRMAAWATPEQIHRSVVDTLIALPDYRFAYMALRDCDVPSMIAKVTAPTLILYGENEGYGPFQETIRPQFRDAHTHALKNSGSTTMLEQPEAFADEVLRFLAPI